MKLSIETVITPEKIINYLLIAKKRNDKSKWLNDAGYTQENWQIFENDLRTQILSCDAVPTAKNDYGQMYEIRGTLSGPNGKYSSRMFHLDERISDSGNQIHHNLSG